MSEREIAKTAKEALISSDLPYSSEVVNIFYSDETQNLMVNSRSPRAKLAIHKIIEQMKVMKFQTFVVSAEQLGLNAKLTAWLTENKPMFDLIAFGNQVTLVRRVGEYQEVVDYLDCTILDSNPQSRDRVLKALNEGYTVQSVKLLWLGEGNNVATFRLNSNLRINKIKFSGHDFMKNKVSTNAFGGHATKFEDYVLQQFSALNAMLKGILHGFVRDTELEKEI